MTYRRLKETLIQLSKGVQKGPAADLIPVLFGERPPTVIKKGVTFTPFNSNLDHSQVCICIIHSIPCIHTYSNKNALIPNYSHMHTLIDVVPH